MVKQQRYEVNTLLHVVPCLNLEPQTQEPCEEIIHLRSANLFTHYPPPVLPDLGPENEPWHSLCFGRLSCSVQNYV